MYRGLVSVRQISVYAKHLPRGAATWTMIGGGAAITAETETGWTQEHMLALMIWQNGGSKGARPKARPMPKGLNELRQNAERAERQAEAWRRKHLK